jgi:hypothetical protein
MPIWGKRVASLTLKEFVALTPVDLGVEANHRTRRALDGGYGNMSKCMKKSER